MLLSYLGRRLRQRFGSFLLKETNMQPALYFLMLAYLHYPFETSHQNYDQPLFYFALLVALLTNFNFIFTLASFLTVSPILAVPMLAAGLFSCNQKWKLYLLILATGNRAFSGAPRQYFMATCSLLICIQIYRTLVFRTVSQNIQYFTGLAAVTTYYSLSIIAENCDLDFNLQLDAILVLAAASLARSFIALKVDGLKKEQPEHIYSGRIMAHYLKMLQEDTKNPYLLQTRILFHSNNCRKNSCFCHSKEHNQKTEYLLRQLYQNALQKFKNDTDFLLFENYVDFLLRNEQAINALYFLGNWKPQGFFSLVGRQRSKARVQRVLRDANSSNLYELQYQYALQYDHHYQRVTTEINSILKLKLQFWGEVSRETPKVLRMQRLGTQIINRMHELNIFYNSVIKGYERSLFLFDTTALYAMYMLSTTNFKEYAELIIKNTAKLLQEVYVFQNNSSETFAIRTVVRRQKDSFIDHPRENLKALRQMGTSHTFVQINDNTCCKLIIDAVSSGLCSIINIRRSELIGRELNSIIPDGYKEVHNVRLSYLLDFQSDTLKEIVPSKVMHQQLKLPIKCEHDKLAMGYVCIKFIVDLVQGLSFVSVVKLARDRSSHVLMDFHGRVTQSEDGFNKEILQHSEIQRYLQRLRDSWQSEKVIPAQRFNLMINTANYGITISSPLLGLFLQKENLKEKCPPIHLEITNEETTRNRTVQTDKYNKIGMQIRQMEKAINTYDAESSTSNSKSGSSAVTIINNFAQTSSTPIYRFIQIAFLASILTCILSNLGAFFVTDLSWDVTSPAYNPLNDTMNLYAIQMLTIKAVLTYGDVQSYVNLGNALNKTRISQYFGQGTYETSISQQISKMETALKDSVLNSLATPSQLLQPYINEQFSIPLLVLNPATVVQLLNTSTRSQNLTYLSLLMIYTTDLNLLRRFDIDSPVMKFSYSVQVANTQNCTFLSPIIDSAVQHSQTVAVAVHLALMVLIALLLIPLYLLLKKRLSLHEKVFDLLVSIDAQQVANQIHSLQYICNILRNSKQSNEIMKMNVLGYEQNVIHPKGSRRSSSDNEMVLGLQKYDTSIQNFEININRTPPALEHPPQRTDTRNSNKRRTQILNQNLTARSNMMNSNSVLGLIKKSYLNTQQQRSENMRKRSGQLDLTGSLLDPSHKLITEHCILYLVSLSFLLLLGLSIHFKLQFDAEYLRGKEHLLDTYSDQIIFERRLLGSKVMLLVGSDFYAKFRGASSAPDIFVPMLNSFPSYNHYDGMDMYAQIMQNCSTNAPLSPNFIAKYCQFDYSEVILKGQFGSLLKQIMELRYMVDKNMTNLNPNTTVVNIIERIFYLHSLNLRLEELVLKKVAILFDSIVELGQSYQQKKELILMGSVLWGILCFILGFWMVVRMKQSYFKEVFMITFLNNEMILKNKRVESFLELIAKSAST